VIAEPMRRVRDWHESALVLTLGLAMAAYLDMSREEPAPPYAAAACVTVAAVLAWLLRPRS